MEEADGHSQAEKRNPGVRCHGNSTGEGRGWFLLLLASAEIHSPTHSDTNGPSAADFLTWSVFL